METPTPRTGETATGTAGRTVGNRYTLGESVGSGGMGTVWRAYDQLLHRDVAVKEVLLPPGLPAPERKVLCERTLREARAAAALNHPAVVRVYDVVQDGERPWIVMELLEARSISELIRDEGPMPLKKVAEIGLAVLGALEAAHRIGVLHRDVKPGNVLIGTDGRTTLTDFGVARSANESPLTSTGLLLGSPQYIAPERARGQAFGPSSDLWSLGATLYTAVEGRPPFDRGDPLPTMTAVVCEPPDPITFAGPLAPILDGLMEKDPAKRWDTPRTRSALKIVLAGGSIAPVVKPAAAPVSPTSPAKPGGQRRALTSRLANAVGQRTPQRAIENSGATMEATGAMEAPVFTDTQPRVGHDGLPVRPTSPGHRPAAAPASPPAGQPVGQPQGPPQRHAAPPSGPPSHAQPAPPVRPPAALAPPQPGGNATRMMPGVGPQQPPAPHATQVIGPRQPDGPAKPRRSVYLESPEAMRASAAGETTGIPRPGRPADQRRMMVFAAIAVAVVLVMGLGAYAIAQFGSATPAARWIGSESSSGGGTSAQDPAFTEWTHPTGGYSVQVPKGWKLQWDGTHTRAKFYNASGAVYVQLYQNKVGKASIEDVWKAGENYQKKNVKDYARVAFKPAKIAGQDALDWEWTYFSDKTNVTRHILDRGIVIDGTSYELYISAPDKQYAANVHLLDKVSESFRITK
ncbi:MAG: eukaryotic-like serine/threonine-protein kinase [Cryptosporangiaceae bacterium]|nr:eukaryotic-like serine/threonine-protein kinase [Cryptosporangiaceae bacterium]